MKLPKWATTVTPLSKTVALILFITLPIVGFYLGFTFQQNASLSNQQTIEQRKIIQPTTSPSFVSLTLRDVTFEIPRTWWYQYGENDAFPIVWYEIHPVRINRELTIPDFQFSVEGVSSSKKVDDFAKIWHLVQVSYKDVVISGYPGKQIIGIADPNYPHYNSRFRKNDKVAITVFERDGYSYQLLGLLNNYEQEYFQIIKSISFQNTY